MLFQVFTYHHKYVKTVILLVLPNVILGIELKLNIRQYAGNTIPSQPNNNRPFIQFAAD